MSIRAIAACGWLSTLLLATGWIDETPAARVGFIMGAVVWIAYVSAGRGKA